MAAIPEHFARVAGRVDLDLVGEKRVVIIGVGTVGSPIAFELAGSGVRRFRLIDGDTLEAANITKHALKKNYIGKNKAEGMAEALRDAYPPPSAEVEYLPQHIDGSVSDGQLDQLLADADLVIAATDDRAAQHRIAARALANDIPAIFPGLYEAGGGGEVFVSLGHATSCLRCWEAFRDGNADLRAVAALNVEVLSVVSLAVQLAVGILDPGSEFARHYALRSGANAAPTLFRLPRPFAALQYATVPRRANCPMCAGGPAAGVHPQRPQQRSLEQAMTDAADALRGRPSLAVTSLAAFVLFLVALSTGNSTSVVLFAAALTASLALSWQPNLRRVLEAAQTSTFGIVGLVDLVLFIAAAAAGDSAVVLLFAISHSFAMWLLCGRRGLAA